MKYQNKKTGEEIEAELVASIGAISDYVTIVAGRKFYKPICDFEREFKKIEEDLSGTYYCYVNQVHLVVNKTGCIYHSSVDVSGKEFVGYFNLEEMKSYIGKGFVKVKK